MIEFRKEGRADLGDQYFVLLKELHSNHLADTTFIIYGHDANEAPHLFEVNSGVIANRLQMQYVAIGTGSSMANSALRLKPMDHTLPSTVYRLLAAKFSAETATGIGRSTTLTVKVKGKRDQPIFVNTIETIRDVWDKERKKGEPEEALSALEAALSPFTSL